MELPLPSREDLGPRGRRTWDVLRAIVHEFRVENIPFMAGSIAYHAFVSMLPLLVLLLFAVSSIADASLTERVLTAVEIVLTPQGRDLVESAVTTGDPSRGVSLLGGLVLLWTTLRIFRGFDKAFSDVYESADRNTILDQIGDGIVVLLTVAGAIVLSGIARSVVQFDASLPGQFVETALVVVGLTLALFPMFYLFPDTDVSVKGVLPGTVLAAGGITVLESLFRLYVQFGGPSRSYGILGAILVLLTWLYLIGLAILLGAVVNAVLTNRSEDVDIAPVIGDWRPGIGTTFGPAAWGNPEREVVATRIETLAERVDHASEEETPLIVSVGNDRIRFPPPETVRTDTDREDDDGVGIELRW